MTAAKITIERAREDENGSGITIAIAIVREKEMYIEVTLSTIGHHQWVPIQSTIEKETTLEGGAESFPLRVVNTPEHLHLVRTNEGVSGLYLTPVLTLTYTPHHQLPTVNSQ